MKKYNNKLNNSSINLNIYFSLVKVIILNIKNNTNYINNNNNQLKLKFLLINKNNNYNLNKNNRILYNLKNNHKIS